MGHKHTYIHIHTHIDPKHIRKYTQCKQMHEYRSSEGMGSWSHNSFPQTLLCGRAVNNLEDQIWSLFSNNTFLRCQPTFLSIWLTFSVFFFIPIKSNSSTWTESRVPTSCNNCGFSLGCLVKCLFKLGHTTHHITHFGPHEGATTVTARPWALKCGLMKRDDKTGL